MEPVARRLDLRGSVCPINFVRIKIALDGLHEGELLEAVVDPSPVSLEVERSLREQGYRVLERAESGDQAILRVLK